MKKLVYGILIAILLIVLANFTLWFFNTRAITQSLEHLKIALADDDLEFSYAEITFDSFKAWRIEGVVVEPSLKYKFLGKFLNLNIPRVHFTSYPFSDELELSMPGDHFLYKFADKLIKKDENVKVQYDTLSPPTFYFSFNKSLSELVPLFQENNTNLFRALKNISLKASGLNCIDNKTSALVSKTGAIDIEANFVAPTADGYGLEGIIKIKDASYNPDYIPLAPVAEKAMYEYLVKTGTTDLNLDFALHHSGKTEKSHGDYKFTLKKLDYRNHIYAFDAGGTLELPSASTLPYVDMTINVDNYIEMIDFYDGYINAVYNNMGNSASHAKMFALSGEHIKVLKNILAKFATADNKKLVLVLNRTADKEFTISGRSFGEVITMLQPLFEAQAEHLKSTAIPVKPGTTPALTTKPEMTTGPNPHPVHPAPHTDAPSEKK